MKKYSLPNDYKGGLIITWDYELQKGADSCTLGKKEWGMDDHTETEKLLKILSKYSIPSTFYCLGYAAMNDKLPYCSAEQIRMIDKQGHEIGSHTFYHEKIPNLTYEQLKETLIASKEILESVIDNPVISFAPPHHYPTQYLRKLAVARDVSFSRLEIQDVCKALHETGYKTARILYGTIPEFFKKKIFGIKHLTHDVEINNNIFCFRLSCAAGFTECAMNAVQEAIKHNNIAVIYAHPHSLKADNPQNVKYLIPFLEHVNELRSRGELWITTPSEIYTYIENQG
jgi:peptidoglycan/xylan/chitin deacetylase (PgdA/CDA1 family)